MSNAESKLREDVAISVERMMRFCHLAQMTFESASGNTKVLPLHLTRFGVLVIESPSFLYSLFEDRADSVNLPNIWKGFEHPFGNELKSYEAKLSPFKKELKQVRNRVGFHGSRKRNHEKAGLGIFDVDSQRAREFIHLVREMHQLCLHMIAWYIERMDSNERPIELWREFITEMQGSISNPEKPK